MMARVLTSFFLFAVFSVPLIGADSDQREWKDAAGKVLAKGEFISVMDGEVCLLTPQGTGATIPLDKLCDADRRFAENNGEDLAEIKGDRPETEDIGAAKPRQRETPQAPTLSVQQSQPNPDLETGMDVIAEASSGEARGDIQKKVKDDRDRYAGQKRVVMFDFESLWDADMENRYGQIMGNMFWMKLNREKGFVIPESMIDVRSVCETHGIKPNPETSMDQMKEWVTKTFNSDIGIWGKIERVDKDVMEIYDFWLKVVDFSQEPPKIIYEVNKARTDAVAEVTGIYVRHALEKLYDRQARSAEETAEIEKNWEKNPNLMPGGDFEAVVGGIPVGWEARCAQHREPIGRLVKRVSDPEKSGNHYLHTEFDAEIGDGFGLMYYSKPFPIEEGALYRIQFRYKKSSGVKPILFVKCYDTIDTIFQKGDNALVEGFDDKAGRQTREVYRSQQNLFESPAGNWVEHSQEFTPRHTRFFPKQGRVMLYGHMGAGSIDYDDFVLKKVKEADPEELKAKIRRHSLDSKVTLKEMEENERRGQESRDRIQQERKQVPGENKPRTKIK